MQQLCDVQILKVPERTHFIIMDILNSIIHMCSKLCKYLDMVK